MDRLRPDQVFNAAVVGLYDRIEAHTLVGRMLDDVETLMKGRRTNQQLNRPLLAVVPGQATPVPGTRGSTTFTHAFSFPIRIHAQVINVDEVAGQLAAASLAGRAQHACFTDPVTGFEFGRSTTIQTPVGEFQMDFGPFDYSISSPNNDNLFEARGAIVFPRLTVTY